MNINRMVGGKAKRQRLSNRYNANRAANLHMTGTMIITGSDAGYFEYARELILSLDRQATRDASLGFLDLGLAEEQRQWLRERGATVVRPQSRLDFRGREWPVGMFGYLARPYMRENFPGFDTYVWLDADAWLQDSHTIAEPVAAATDTGAAFVRQREPSYRYTWWLRGWFVKHYVLGYGVVRGLLLASMPAINNGVFAIRAGAPHWDAWHRHYQAAYDRTQLPGPHDQFSLNAAVLVERLPASYLPATYNWICDLARPVWDAETGTFRVPRGPHELIRVMHLAGPAKKLDYDLEVLGGGSRRGSLRFGRMADAPSGQV